RIDGVLQNQNTVGNGQRQCTTGTTFPGDGGNGGNPEPGHFAQISRDRFRLASLLGCDTRIGTGEINEGEYRTVEFFRNLHGAQRLTVALRVGHAEITAHLFFGSTPLEVADDHHFLTVEAGHSTRHGEIVPKGAVTAYF